MDKVAHYVDVQREPHEMYGICGQYIYKGNNQFWLNVLDNYTPGGQSDYLCEACALLKFQRKAEEDEQKEEET